MLTDTRLTDVDWDTCTVVSTDTQLQCLLIFDRYVDRVSADSVKLLILSYGVHKLWKISTTVTFFCPQGGHCGEVQMYLKIRWKSKGFAQSSISYCLFSGRREYQRLIVLNRVWADLQMFWSGSNNIEEYLHVAEVMNVMATGKRSQVARLVNVNLHW